MARKYRQKPVPESLIDYREILAAEMAKRRVLQPRYSLRDFAKDLGILPSHLSEVLHKKKGISILMARKIAARMPLTKFSQHHFELLVDARSARARYRRICCVSILRRGHYQRNEKEFLFLQNPQSWADEIHSAYLADGPKHRFERSHILTRLNQMGYL